jgi:hypothetical protein
MQANRAEATAGGASGQASSSMCFSHTPEPTEPVGTRYRRIGTPIPVPESLAVLERLRELEPRSMSGQPPIVWHHGDGATVSDAYGNTWIDFSSGVLVTSCGHAHPRITAAITGLAQQGLHHAYCFATEARAELVRELASWLPEPLCRVFLLTTGAEATECCIKLARTCGMQRGDERKNVIVSFDHAFHGRTMGAQLAGGSPGLKGWLGSLGKGQFVSVPYPDGFRQRDTGFDVFERALAEQGVTPDRVCGVISENLSGMQRGTAAPRLCAGAAGLVRSVGRGLDSRRSSSRIRSYGSAVWLFSSGYHARPGRVRQGHFGRYAPFGGAGYRRIDESVRSGRDDQHPFRESDLLCGCSGESAGHSRRRFGRARGPACAGVARRLGAHSVSGG